MDRNRHGVPLYRTPGPRAKHNRPIAARREDVCVWPACPNDRWLDAQLAVCEIHANVIEHRVRSRREEAIARINAQMVPRQRETPEPDPSGWIYYIKVDGHYKIGYTKNVRARIKGYPPTAELMAQHRGTKDDEKALHHRFGAYRVAGREWYSMADEITQYIESVVTIHGKCVDAFEVSRRKSVQPVQLRRRSRISGFR